MATQNGIDFQKITPHCGGQYEAFEELCCQLALKTLPVNINFHRLKGAGGDGGVECFADLKDGSRIGWQAKYVFKIGPLLTQATKSLNTALEIHPTLKKYMICFPFNLTGTTARAGHSGVEKFESWKKKQEEKIAANGRQLIIERWSASELLGLLLEHDISGGMRAFFFSQEILTRKWFSTHLRWAKDVAGPRYTPPLNVKTDLWQLFTSFGHSPNWLSLFKEKLSVCQKMAKRFASVLDSSKLDSALPSWPQTIRENAQILLSDIEVFLGKTEYAMSIYDSNAYHASIANLENILSRLRLQEAQLADNLESQYGLNADSPSFRQHMAEYQISFPANNLDITRKVVSAFEKLKEWFASPACFLAYQRMFVLSGVAGAGKTHGICDAALFRLDQGLLSCISFGHEFNNDSLPWSALVKSLGLSGTFSRDMLLDALNSAAEASGSPLIIFVDAINETKPWGYWSNNLLAFSQAIQERRGLRLCVSCRTSFCSICLPQNYEFRVVEHRGFKGIEREAAQSFFKYYELEVPITPILQPEMSNPLYLRLLCETLKLCGLTRIPIGWRGLAPIIKAFLNEKEKQFEKDHEGVSAESKIVIGSLIAIARTIAKSGESALPHSRVYRAICEERPQVSSLPGIIGWLVRANLLIEDGPLTETSLEAENTVRIAFERLGDFLIAEKLLEQSNKMDIESECQPGGKFYFLLKNSDAVVQNNGVLTALSILFSESEKNHELELTDLVKDELIFNSLMRLVIQSFPYRSPLTLSQASVSLLQKVLGPKDPFFSEAMGALLAIAWQPSTIDGIWLDSFLKGMPLARRDALWCDYLHKSFESNGVVSHLINSVFEVALSQLEPDIAERWVILLLWFTASADRRVKDKATRAAVAILTTRPHIILEIAQRMINVDDDEVRERTLLSCYAALINTRDADTTRSLANLLHQRYLQTPTSFDNALIRDCIRCISELALELNALPDNCEPEFTMQPFESDWPLSLPLKEEVERCKNLQSNLPKLAQSCLEDDFFTYTMGCLGPWEEAFPRNSMGKWILQRVVSGLAYENSGCNSYDNYMLKKYGSGRARLKWAERIGKKYQRIALSQLVSRLHNHLEKKQENGCPDFDRTPLILLGERKIDPTLPANVTDENDETGYWVMASADFGVSESLSDEEWVCRENDIPSLEVLLSSVEHNGQKWRQLVSDITWRQPEEGDESRNEPYRYISMYIKSYLVPIQDFSATCKALVKRNFFRGEMPEGASWSHGFAGEYPWATPFNTESEEWHERGLWPREEGNVSLSLEASWNQLAMEWGSDASVPRYFHMFVPARIFFSFKNLYWNGQDGYRLINGATVFRDPSITEPGSKSLLVDACYLPECLSALGFRLIWTMHGCKAVVGSNENSPKKIFSQVAHLAEDGTVYIEERAFFGDYQEKKPIIKKRKKLLL